MKKSIIFLLLSLVYFNARASKDWNVRHNKVNNGNEIVFNAQNFSLSDVKIEGNNYCTINFDGGIKNDKAGWASLPYVHASLLRDNSEKPQLEIEILESEEIKLQHPLVPAKKHFFRYEGKKENVIAINPKSIVDEWYPQNAIQLSEPFCFRKNQGISVYFYPFQYNAKKQILKVISKVRVKVIENKNSLKSNIAFDRVIPEEQICQNIFINYNQSRKKADLKHKEDGELLILVTKEDELEVGRYAQWKVKKGIKVTTIVCDSASYAKDYIKEAYDKNPKIFYVLIAGDWLDIQSIYNKNYRGLTDPVLGCVSGNDQLPDLAIGRFSGTTSDEIRAQVAKTIRYEKEPDMNGEWYSKHLGIASDEGEGKNPDDSETDTEHMDIIWTERLKDFTYTENTKLYDEPNSQVSRMDVYNAVTKGVGLINYIGHGSQISWRTSGFDSENIKGLNNEQMLPVIFSTACDNGMFNGSRVCFAEAWLRNPKGGAVAMLASSIGQDWASPMRGQDYMMDILIGGYDYDKKPGNGINTKEQRTLLGSVVLNAFALMYTESQGYWDVVTIHTWTTFGDPCLQIRTAKPSKLNVEANSFGTESPFKGKVLSENKPVENAHVCISQGPIAYSGYTDKDGKFDINHNLGKGIASMVVTGFNTETIVQEVKIVDNVGLEETFSQNDIQIFPNPNSGIFHIKFNNSQEEDYTIKVVNINGKLVYNKQITSDGSLSHKVQLADKDISSGVYFVQIMGKEGIKTEKFVVR
ncbi:MAG: C25 family cysteine peptidase [Bacteroidales bacterium]